MNMKEKILEISEKLRLELINEHEAQKLLLSLFTKSNNCNECNKKLDNGTVFCSNDCRIHYYS